MGFIKEFTNLGKHWPFTNSWEIGSTPLGWKPLPLFRGQTFKERVILRRKLFGPKKEEFHYKDLGIIVRWHC